MGTAEKKQNPIRKRDVLFIAAVFLIIECLLLFFLAGNFYIRQDSLETHLRDHDPNIFRLIELDRNIVYWSRAAVLMKDGSRVVSCVDSNLLFTYRIVNCGNDQFLVPTDFNRPQL